MTDREHDLYFFLKQNSTLIFHFKMDFDNKLHNSCYNIITILYMSLRIWSLSLSFLFPSHFIYALQYCVLAQYPLRQLVSLWATCLFSSVEFFSLLPLGHCKEYVYF